MLEIRERDAGGRLGKWFYRGRRITLPALFPVLNPGNVKVHPDEMKKAGCEVVMVSSFILRKYGERDVHDVLGWDGIVYTDSGTFQMYSVGISDLDPREVIEYQERVGSDLITPLDIFTLPDDSKPVAKEKLEQTLKNVPDREDCVFPIQGGVYPDLRKKACEAGRSVSNPVFAIGGIVPLMESYDFKRLADVVLSCTSSLPPNKPVHAFGCGHPMIFSLLVAFGCDIFDSAMYALAARRGGYLTASGTKNLDELREFPCFCPACSKHDVEEVKRMEKPEKEEFLARHNFYVSIQEIKNVRNAISENRLWELVQERCRSHPKILEAFEFALKKYKRFFLKRDPVTKKSAFFYSGPESKLRPEVIRAKEWSKRVKTKEFVFKKPFGKFPAELSSVYPFSQSVVPGEGELSRRWDEKTVRAVLDYQFGEGTGKMVQDLEIEFGRTGRPRKILSGGEVIGTIRARDGFFLPTVKGAEMINAKRVEVKEEGVEYVGRGVLARFCKPLDEILPGEEVAVTFKGRIIGVGRSLLNTEEMEVFERGTAVKVRSHVKCESCEKPGRGGENGRKQGF